MRRPWTMPSCWRSMVATTRRADMALSSSMPHLSWGGRDPTTRLVLLLNGIGFEGGLAGVSNLDGKVTFASLVPLRTADAQHLTANLRIASLPPGPLDLRFGLPGRDRLAVDRVTLGLAGVTIAGGRLGATGPGVVRYTGAGLPEAITGAQGKAGDALTLTRQALADFHYSGLTLALDRSPSGDGSLLVGLKGNNPGVLDGHPFEINIRLDANFDRLATIFLSGYAAAEGLL